MDTTFAPTLNGTVNAVIAGPTVNTVYVGGAFNTVNGVPERGIVLLNLSDGSIVSGFASSVTDGQVFSMRLSGGHLYLVGSFTMIGGASHGGVGTINPTTGALDPFVTTQLTGHHNYNGTGASGPVGGHAIDISPDGTLAVVIGNFKNANGVLHDQIVLLTLTGTSAIIDPNWNTSAFTASCLTSKFDSYVEDVAFSPDGSYFVIADTGSNSGTLNTDGSRSLCDAASRWSTTDTGTDVAPTWVDYTGNDSFWSVAVTGTAIYAGGHPRWINNPGGSNNVGPGAIPRPGLVALDPVNGLPLAWNPGRNPRGVGAFALLATAQGLYVGSDTNYFGTNPPIERDEIGFFPLTGGYTPASEATTALPANIYEAGPTNSTNAGVNDLAYRSSTAGTSFGTQTVVPNTGISWSTTRGAFMAGSNVYYGSTVDGNFYSASFTGSSASAPVSIDPYDDPVWDGVQTGSGQTYQGQKSGYYSEIPSVTGAFYSDGRLYYSLAGKTNLRWRYFTPDSGAIGGTESTVPGGSFGSISGMFLSGGKIYYSNSTDGTLHTIGFSNGGTNGINPSVSGTDAVVSGPLIDGNDWRSQSMFLFQPSTTTQSITFNAATHAAVASGTSVPLTTPASVVAGDAELLYVTTSNAAPGVIATPVGWTPVTTQNSSPLQTAVFTKTATASDAGSLVTATVTATGPLAAQLVDYSGVGTALPVTTGASDSSKTTHVAPAIQVASSGSWVVSFWSDKSSSTTSWTLPAVSTPRDQVFGSGSNRVTAALGDSNAIVPTGTYPARSASVGGTASGKGAMVSLVLVPQTVVATTTPSTTAPTTTPTTAPTTTPTTTTTAPTTTPTTTPPPPPPAAFTASVHGVVASATTIGLTTPAAVATGDAELLYVTTSNAQANAIVTPTGWTLVAAQNSSPLQAAVFTKTAASTDAGSIVTATVTSAGPLAAQLVDYTGLTATPPVTAGASDSSTATHIAPVVQVATAGSWVVSFWSDKSSSTTGWTTPAGTTQRDLVLGSGGGRVTAVLADSAAAVVIGTYPTQTATVNDASGKGAMISLVLVPTS